jgi:hypothetical protein
VYLTAFPAADIESGDTAELVENNPSRSDIWQRHCNWLRTPRL